MSRLQNYISVSVVARWPKIWTIKPGTEAGACGWIHPVGYRPLPYKIKKIHV